MIDLNPYRDSIHGLLLPSALTFACLGTNDYQIRKYRDAEILKPDIDFIRLNVQNSPRIFYTLIGLQKLTQLVATETAKQFEQQLFQLQNAPQLPAAASTAQVNFTMPYGVSTDPLDPLAPAHLLASAPASSLTPQTHPGIALIAEEVATHLETVIARHAAQLNPAPQSDAQILLQGQKLMMDAIHGAQQQTAEAVTNTAYLVNDAIQQAKERKDEPDTLAHSLIAAAFVCALFVAAFVLSGLWVSLTRPVPTSAQPTSTIQP